MGDFIYFCLFKPVTLIIEILDIFYWIFCIFLTLKVLGLWTKNDRKVFSNFNYFYFNAFEPTF